MSDDFYDDDAQYDDYDDDDDVDDDDESVTTYKRPSTNPLYRSGSSGLPGRNRFGDSSSTPSSSSASGSGRLGVRPFSAGGSSSDDDDEDSSSSSRGSEDLRSSIFNRDRSSNSSPSSSGSSSSGIGNRFGSSSGGSSSSTPSRSSYSSGSSTSSSGLSGRYSRDSDSSSSSSDDRGSRMSPTPSSSSSGSSGSSSFGRYSSGGSSSPSSSTPSSSGSSSGFRSSSASTSSTPSRPASSSPSSSSASSSSASSSPSRSSDSKSNDKDSGGSSVAQRFGAGLSNIRSRVSGGGEDKAKDKPASKPKDGEKSGLFSRVSASLPIGGNKSDDKPKAEKKPADGEKGGIGAALGGLTSRFKRGGDDAPPKSSSRPGAPSSSSSASSSTSSASTSRFGSFRSGGSSSTPSSSSSSSATSNAPTGGRMSAFGLNRNANASSAPADKTKKADAKESGGGLFGRIASSIPFVGGSADDKSQRVSKTRQAQSKIPKTRDDAGLSLDDKLDILGVGSVVTALILFVSSLSPQQGAITGSINDLISRIFGWGAFAVPVALMAFGLWLIVRHFGDDAPEVDPVRVTGITMLYIGALMVFQYIETFNDMYRYATQENLYLFVQESISAGRGGGMIGAELYYLVISNVGEIPGFTLILGWMVVGIMLATRTSAAELAVFVISIWRSFQVSVQQRAQARAIAQLEAREAEQISVSRPTAGELAAGTSTGALPAPAAQLDEDDDYVPIEERAIPIRMGGQMINAGEPVMAQSATQQPAATTQAPIASPPATSRPKEDDSSGGFMGGIAARLKGAVPALPAIGSGSSDDEKISEKSEKSSDDSGGLLGGLFNRRSASSGNADTPASTPARPATTSQSAQPPPPRTLPQTQQPAASTPLGNLMGSSQAATAAGENRFNRPAASLGTPPQQPAASTSSFASRFGRDTAEKDEEREEATSINRAGPAQNPFSRVASTAAGVGASLLNTMDDDEDDDSEELVVAPPEDDMMSRLPPAQPKGVIRRPEPTTPNSFASRFNHAETAADEDDEDEEETTTTQAPAASLGGNNAIADRINRMNAIRSGSITPANNSNPRSALEEDDAVFKADFVDDFDDDEDDEDDDESVTFTRPTSNSIFGRSTTPSTPAATPTTNGSSDEDRSRVRAFDPTRYNKPPASTSTTPVEQPKPAASSPPWQTDSTPKPTTPTPQPQQQQPAATQTASQPAAPPPQPRPATPDPVINLPQAPKPAQQPAVSHRQWRLPDYRTLLASGSEQDFDREALVKRARIIEETLQSFGAPGRVVEINTGPVITQFGVEPDYLTARGGKKSRVKVSAIAQLDKDLQLALGAKSIRVEAPVPGKGYVGIEVPNEEASLVSLRDVMEARQFTKISEKSPLAIALGQSVDGAPVAADLASMPHLLIAGTTGSGKSVCVNAVIASILIRNTPEQVKFIMVDPKRVELTGYNGIPHLVAPVVVELERIVGVLKWVTREMDERYKKFSEAGRRNIEDYNKNLTAPMEPMPYIVVIIDELADLMMLAPDETERVITRIAALARATGIHLVIATQRPSVDVVTGLIKANFPARVAFAVASGTDSRVILDQPGADRLLGRGDMLYMSGDAPAPQRLQGVYVSDMEINNITRYWRTQAPPDAPQKPITALVMDDSPAPQSRTVMPRGERFMQPPPASTQRAFWDNNNNDDDEDLTDGESDALNSEDELYSDAVELVRRLNKASVSLLQRRLRIGYTRAARMIDMMEAENIIGPPTEGSKPREVLPYKK